MNLDFENHNREKQFYLDVQKNLENNKLGNQCLNDKNLDKALYYYKKNILSLNSQSIDFRNIALVYEIKKDYLKSIRYLNLALELDMNDDKTYFKLGLSYYNLGNFAKAEENFKNSFKIDNQNSEALNFWTKILIQQGKWFSQDEEGFLKKNLTQSSISKNGIFYICLLINNILLNRNRLNGEIFNSIKNTTKNLEQTLNTLPKSIYSYFIFLIKLNNQIINFSNFKSSKTIKNIYHIGESHSLSFVNQIISTCNTSYKIKPQIVFGAKAWHLGNAELNIFKFHFKYYIKNIEELSTVLISFGEIDCRSDEGIINAYLNSNHNGYNIEHFVNSTVTTYIEFCEKNLMNKKIKSIYLGVPAPLLDKIDKKKDDLRLEIIECFNKKMKQVCKERCLFFIDTYHFTKNKIGTSNQKYMIDNNHLNFKFLKVIQKKLIEFNL